MPAHHWRKACPFGCNLAPKVREVFLDYQEIVSTRNDLGQLASMHNKYERLALYRLRASMKEFLGELPPEVERAFAEPREADSKAVSRAFVPTRPTLLRKGEQVESTWWFPGPPRCCAPRCSLARRNRQPGALHP